MYISSFPHLFLVEGHCLKKRWKLVILKFAPTHFKFSVEKHLLQRNIDPLQTQLHSRPNIPNTTSWYTYRARLGQFEKTLSGD
jgi:hypothetical protein